ncbi:Two-component response transcriptional regulator [Streptococcus massiliensis]|uniref:Two-component response transcriptional regulator n=1 Tax=Streptococcus massiliensis TaxID=313439 RepID=A0A380KZ81_9STRE|nr:Two-component response transcriptional regulator [Streptococcus massiliensis]
MLKKIQKKLVKEQKQERVEELLSESEHSDLAEAIASQLSNSQLTLKSLAQELGFSPSYLSVLIKKDLGMPFQDYLIQIRMNEAKLLLLTTDLKIYEIAERVGFEDMNYFSQRFKQIVGLTPRQYKKGGQM